MTGTSPVSQSGMAIINEYSSIALRGKWLILGCVTLSAALAWGYCVIATKYYWSQTLIVAEGQKPLEKYPWGKEGKEISNSNSLSSSSKY